MAKPAKKTIRKPRLICSRLMLNIGNALRRTQAVAAIASESKTSYVPVTMSRPSDIAGLRRAGWQVAHPTWGAFMVKPLTPEVTVEDARRLFGIGTDRFLISWLAVT